MMRTNGGVLWSDASKTVNVTSFISTINSFLINYGHKLLQSHHRFILFKETSYLTVTQLPSTSHASIEF